jgi:hypothetical protein
VDPTQQSSPGSAGVAGQSILPSPPYARGIGGGGGGSNTFKRLEFLLRGGVQIDQPLLLERAQDANVCKTARSPAAQEAQWQSAVSYLQEERWKEAAAEFRKVDRENKLYPRAERWAQGMDQVEEIPQKSPATAGVLAAVLPGAGHLYDERYRDAGIAFPPRKYV